MNRKEAIIAGIAGVAVTLAADPSADAQSPPEANPELDQVRALLQAHHEAFSNHDMDGVLACFTEKAAIMGSGPGEIWSGPDEIKAAYQHFFKVFDKGTQKFENQFRIGGLGSGMGWMMTAGNVTAQKEGKDIAFPINLSVTVEKNEGKWLVAAMHFSTLTSGSKS